MSVQCPSCQRSDSVRLDPPGLPLGVVFALVRVHRFACRNCILRFNRFSLATPQIEKQDSTRRLNEAKKSFLPASDPVDFGDLIEKMHKSEEKGKKNLFKS